MALGHFMPQGDPRNSDDVEIKWGVHPAGETRPGWVTDDPRSMLSVLVSGRFRIDLPDRSVVLAEQGDYIVFHGVNHTWEAEEASVVVSVRWPSLPGFDLPGCRPGDGEFVAVGQGGPGGLGDGQRCHGDPGRVQAADRVAVDQRAGERHRAALHVRDRRRPAGPTIGFRHIC